MAGVRHVLPGNARAHRAEAQEWVRGGQNYVSSSNSDVADVFVHYVNFNLEFNLMCELGTQHLVLSISTKYMVLCICSIQLEANELLAFSF